MSPATEKKLLLLILLMGLFVRLVNITDPIADSQSWNQSSAATVIRHLAKDGVDFFHPRWDLLQHDTVGPRIEAEEAPIYHTIVALLIRSGGSIPVSGRLISILFGTLASLYFYRLIRKITDATTALVGTTFFVFAPYSFYFFRTVMSDPAMIFGIVAALFYFDRFCETEKWEDILLAGLCTSLAGLFKPFALHVGFPILILALLRFKWRLFLMPKLYIYAVISLAPTLLWVAWAAKIGTLGGVTEGQSVISAPHLWGPWSMLLDPSWYFRMQWRLFDQMATPIVSLLALTAFISKNARTKARIFFIWLSGIVFYLVLVRSGNMQHDYYQLPAVGPFAGLAAVGLVETARLVSKRHAQKIIAFLVTAFLILSVVYVRAHYNLDMSSEIAGQIARENTVAGERILVMDIGSTRRNQVIFASEREGWYFRRLKPDNIEHFRTKGAAAAVLVLERNQIALAAPAIEYLNEHYKLVGLKEGDFNQRGSKKYHKILVYRLD